MIRDLDDITLGRRETPLILIGSRVAFAALFIFAAFSLIRRDLFPYSILDIPWLAYLVLIYSSAEYVYAIFRKKDIDLTFAFPLLFAVVLFHCVSVLLDGQARFPLMNRAEHFTGYVLITYAIWVFFIQYLPQRVWSRHPYYTAILVFSVAAAVGVLNEIIELVFDALVAAHFIGDRLDTSLDLLMNSLGSALFLAVRLILGAAEEEKKQRSKM